VRERGTHLVIPFPAIAPSKSKDSDLSMAMLEEDLNHTGQTSGAIIDLDTYEAIEAIDEVDEPDFVETLIEYDRNETLNVEDVPNAAAVVDWPPNSFLPPCICLGIAECIEVEPNGETVACPRN
jgi:hypothetical protein